MMAKKKTSMLVEKLAQLEHTQWMAWSKALANKVALPKSITDRWRECWTPYNKLSEEMKDIDRIWARRTLYILKAYFRSQFVVKMSNKKFVEVMRKYKSTSLTDENIDEIYETLNNTKCLFNAKER